MSGYCICLRVCECASYQQNVTRTCTLCLLSVCAPWIPHILSCPPSIIMRNLGTNCSCSTVFSFFLSFSLSRCQDCVLVYVNGRIFTPHGKWWNFHFTSLSFFFVWRLCKCSCPHMPRVYCWLLWEQTAGKALTPDQRQVLYIALCLRVSKAPLIWVQIEPQGASHLVGEVSWHSPDSWWTSNTNFTQ